MRLAVVLLVGIGVIVSPSLALAEVCPLTAPGDDRETVRRLRQVEQTLARHEDPMRWWFGGFAAGHAVMAGGAVALAYAEPKTDGERGELLVGAFGSALGLASLVLARPPLIGASEALRVLPETTPEDRARKLAFGEARLRDSARATRFVRSWVTHVLSGLYSVGSALVVWLAFDRPEGGLRQLVGGAIIGQGRILLHPDGVAEAWDTYRAEVTEAAGCVGSSAPRTAIRSQSLTAWFLTGSPGGLGIGVRF